MQAESGSTPNVLDRWIGAATHSLAAFVLEEMAAYRLYTVVPRLVQFLESLTNVYVRLNRARLRGQGTDARDCHTALSTLFDVLLDTCKVRCSSAPLAIRACGLPGVLHSRIVWHHQAHVGYCSEAGPAMHIAHCAAGKCRPDRHHLPGPQKPAKSGFANYSRGDRVEFV